MSLRKPLVTPVAPALLCSLVLAASPGWSQAQSDAKKPAAEHHMTAAETASLFKSMDEVLAFASKDSHLEIKHPVKREMMSRAQVNALLVKKFNEDDSVRRMERSELVLKKFGLLDPDFNLRPFMISLLTEQIAGFYDGKTGVMHLLDWIAPDDQKPVMAHELTHALQDQRVKLEKWGDITISDPSKDAKDDRRHVAVDEASTSREAVTEGQAMVVFIDYMLKPYGKTLADAPEMGEKMRELQSASSGDSPILNRAPYMIQQSLLFPYTDGLTFELAVLSQDGVDKAFAGALDNPPNTTREVLHPREYMTHVHPTQLVMPDVHPVLDKNWAPYDVGVMGEFDVRMTAELFGGKEKGQMIGPAWDGGLYYAAQRRDATDAEKKTKASIGVLYYSQWKNEITAQAFMKVYENYLGRKYRALKLVADEGDRKLYSTEEGDVVLSLRGKGLFISEGFENKTAGTLETLFRESQGVGPVQMAAQPKQVPMHDPGMEMMHTTGMFGVPRAVLQQMKQFEK